MKGTFVIAAFLLIVLSICAFPNGRIGCLYWGFDWPGVADYKMTQIDMDLTIVNDLETDVCLYYATQLSCGTPTSQTCFYFGIQTNLQGRGKGLLFSRWGTMDLANVKSPGTPDSWVEAGDYEGQFVGVRRLYNWTNHHYVLRLSSSTEEDDEIGRWYHFTFIDTETGEETYVGGLRFFKDANGKYPSILTQGYGCWIEQPVAVSAPEDVPKWTIGIGRPSANNHELWATKASWWFAPVSDSEPWQNNDIWVEDETIYGQIGGDTVRTHADTGSHIYCQNVTISSVSKLGNPFRLRIIGNGFQSNAKVYIGESGSEWTDKRFKSTGKILLKGGISLKNLFPKGMEVEITVVNEDGGTATFKYVR